MMGCCGRGALCGMPMALRLRCEKRDERRETVIFRCRENVIRVGRAAREQGAVRAVALRVRF